MKYVSLRAKMLVSVGTIIFLVLGITTWLHIEKLQQFYKEAIEWRSEGLAQGILSQAEALKNYNPYYAENVQGLLEKLSVKCSQLYDLNKDQQITHIMVINDAGIIAAHNDNTLVGTKVSSALVSSLHTPHPMVLPDQGIYHTLVPIIDKEEKFLGTIDIGVPQHVIDENTQQLLRQAVSLFILFVILAMGMFSGLLSMILTKPIRQVVRVGEKIAEGDIADSNAPQDMLFIEHENSVKDEIGALIIVFRKMMLYLQKMAQISIQISTGDIQQETTPASARDVLGNAFYKIIVYLQHIGHIATAISRGDLREQITLRSAHDHIGMVFMQMQQGLIALISKIRKDAGNVASISSKMLVISSQTSEALTHIGDTAEITVQAIQQASKNVEEVSTNTEQLIAAVGQTGASVTQLMASIREVATHARTLSQTADTTTATIVNILDSLEQIARQTDQSAAISESANHDANVGQESVQRVISSMATIAEVTEDISEIISRLKERSSEIGTILDMINDIAEQTSLLALNASIIAAQAGSHGRGFAVVAEEIKELATRVSTSTKEIARIVTSLQHDSMDAVKVIEHGQSEVDHGVTIAQDAGAALQKIAEGVQNSSKAAGEIADLVNQQKTAHAQITESMKHIATMINEITRATQEQEQQSSLLFNVIDNMQSLESSVSNILHTTKAHQEKVTQAIQKVSSLVHVNLQPVHEAVEIADELASQADALKQQVKQFRLPSSSESSEQS